ncbi:MAG: CPBP family intramembrane metalloprotease [Opitutus sp.]|nr:CPBP family intramembrane metalloprotease [Opitutus sp.]
MITQLACGVVGGGALGVIGAVIDQPTLINDHLPALLVAGNTLAFLYLYFRETKRASLSWGDLSWRLRDAVHLAGPVFVLAAAGVLVVSELTNLATLGVPNSGESILRQVMDLENYPILSPLLIVIVAPITEEILFRGLMLRGLLAVTTPKRAIALTTVLFMIVHLNPWQFPVAAVMGVLTGWVYLRSRSLLLCVGIHTVQNATALFASALPFTIRASTKSGRTPEGFILGGSISPRSGCSRSAYFGFTAQRRPPLLLLPPRPASAQRAATARSASAHRSRRGHLKIW